jgi:hypothetical protein
MIKILRPPELLRQLSRLAAPSSVADGLAPGLEMVEAVREKEGVGGRDQQVIEFALGLPPNPIALLLVEDGPATLV